MWMVIVRNTPSSGRSLPTFNPQGFPNTAWSGGGGASISTPSQKPSLSCLINRKYLLAGRREERGAVWKRELAPSLLGGGPQLLDSFSLSFIVGSSSRCWGPGRCPLPRLLARTGRWVLLHFVTWVGIDSEGSLTPAQSLHSWFDWLGEGYRCGGLSVYETP